MSFPERTAMEVPLLQIIAGGGGSARPKHVYAEMARKFREVSEDDLSRKLPCGGSAWGAHVRGVWKRLVRAGQIDASRFGVWTITASGRRRLRMKWG